LFLKENESVSGGEEKDGDVVGVYLN